MPKRLLEVWNESKPHKVYNMQVTTMLTTSPVRPFAKKEKIREKIKNERNSNGF